MDQAYFFLEDWKVEPELNRISLSKEDYKRLEPQLMALLICLVQHRGQLVTKEKLMQEVWSDVIVSENVLTRAVSSLRKMLGDNRQHPRYIETISKTGYRLIGKVKYPSKKGTADDKVNITVRKKPLLIVVSAILLILLAAFSTWRVFLPPPVDIILHPVALANHSNAEYWPAISPDGKFVAFGWKGKENDNWDIYAKLIGTQTVLRITDNPATDLRARWSPDGNYIYYVRYENGGGTIYKKSVIGGGEIRILKTPRYCSGDFDISPDERWISFNDREDKLSPLRIKLISLETGEAKWLTKPREGFNGDIHPTFSPDGNKLAFIREKNSVSMYLWSFDLISKKIEQVTSEHISINGFDWSNDGKALFYGSDKTGLYKLWEVNLDTKQPIIMNVGDYQMVMPRVAETGRIIYAKMKDNVNIWSYNLKGKTAKAWYATNDLNLNPVISPTGEKVCFTMNKDGLFQIWVSNMNGTDALPITNFPGQYLNAPRWSSDGESILFHGFLDGQADIYRVNALGGIPENLTSSPADDHNPFIADNGKIIYFSSNRSGEWGIWRMEADGSNQVQIIGNNAYAPQLSRDEKTVYYCKKGVKGLWALDLEKRGERLLIEAFHPMNWGAFAVDQNGIYYLNALNKRFEYFDLITGQSSFIYQPQARIPRLGITMHLSPDSEQLLFSQVDHIDADIMLLERQN